MKDKVPNFKIETSNGSVALVFQTTSHTCKMKFENEALSVEIDGQLVWSADKF